MAEGEPARKQGCARQVEEALGSHTGHLTGEVMEVWASLISPGVFLIHYLLSPS